MKFVTDMLSRWATATGRQAGVQLRGIAELDLPASLVPVFMPRVPIPYAGPGLTAPSAVLQRDSFFTGLDGGATGVVAATDVELAALGRGDWEIFVTGTAIYTFNVVIPGDRMYLGISPPGNALGNNQQPILTYVPRANVEAGSRDSLTFRLVIAVDDFRFRLHTPALAGGQSEQHSFFLAAHRMG